MPLDPFLILDPDEFDTPEPPPAFLWEVGRTMILPTGKRLAALREALDAYPEHIHAGNWRQETLLHIAVEAGWPDIVTCLLDAGADVNARNHAQWTPLHIAVNRDTNRLAAAQMARLLSIVRMLLERGADPNLVDLVERNGDTPIFYAPKPPLRTRAMQIQVLAMYRLLIDYKARTDGRGLNNSLTGSTQHTLLHFVSEPVLIRMLAAQGVEVNGRDSQGQTPLHRAAASTAYPQITETLIEVGADVNARDRKECTPMHCITGELTDEEPENDQPHVIDHLLRHGALPNAINRRKQTPLHVAVGNHAPHSIKALLAAGADVNTRDRKGRTPLALAESGEYFGGDPYYYPYRGGEGDEERFTANARRIAETLRKAGGTV